VSVVHPSPEIPREPELTDAAIVNVNALARRLRSAGGVVAFATSRIMSPEDQARRLGVATFTSNSRPSQ
jgi:hypothetical protein